MKSRIWICILCIETALALYFAIGAAVSYGRVVPVTTPPCMTPSVTLTRQTSAPRPNSTVCGWATWYSRSSARREGTGGKSILMANGKPLNDTKLTVALWIVGKHGRPLKPDGRFVKITNVATGQTLLAAWTDNGPGRVPRSRGVICDLTPTAMRALAGEAGIKAGRVAVTMEAL